jgi:hypothetical protein
MATGKSGAPGEVLVLVGTQKGAFLLSSDAARKRWKIDGPHFRGEAVYSMALDDRGGRHRIFAGTRSFHWGSVLRASDDFGATWTSPERQNVRFPADSGLSLTQIW